MMYEDRKRLKQFMLKHKDDDIQIICDMTFSLYDYDHEIASNGCVAAAMIMDNDNKIAIEIYNAAKRIMNYKKFLYKIADYRPEARPIIPQCEKFYSNTIREMIDMALNLVG